MDWKAVLEDVDNDYLIGLSNKGIVKRAYKDKGETAAEIGQVGQEAVVKVGEETVTVCFPLAESKCTCPSRSMCRHVVHAILVLQESFRKEGEGTRALEEKEAGQSRALNNGRTAENSRDADNGRTAGNSQDADDGQAAENDQAAQVLKDGTQAQSQETSAVKKSAGSREALQKEIKEYPLKSLKKVLGSRHLQNFVNLTAAGIKPEIQQSSIITLRLPPQEFSGEFAVKLLSPLEYSTCTCHKKELCVHKAAAILWFQLEAKVLTQEGLDTLLGTGGAGEDPFYDMDRVKDAAGQMKGFLEELMATGLSRTSPDALDYLERLAIISHNVGLARFEGYFRALSDSYDRYFKRKASFRTRELTEQLTRLYRRVDLLLKAEKNSQVLRQAGEFRADYLPAGNLDLVGITMEYFQSQTGYEGETVYFLEEKTKKWYTYTSARPVFYEPGKKRGYMEKSQAPWGLNLSLEELLRVRIHLTGAKCDGRRRLSSSQDTKGEVTGERKLEQADIEEWYYEDFGKLYRERIDGPKKWLIEPEELQEGVNLVYVQPDSCAKAEFSGTGQILSMPLYDKAGRELVIEVTYSKKESGTIRYLEKISEKKPPCFVGKLYLREGRMRMYPLDVWKE